jgi:hypothetical protein
MATEPYHQPLTVCGRRYNLAHLDPFVFEANSRKVPHPLRVNVRFTNHCFSEAFDADKHDADDAVIMDGTRRRVFSPGRYALSHHLPDLIRGLAHEKARVNQTAARRNWMLSAIVEVSVDTVRYQIFFELRRTRPDRARLQDLDMVVESAYPADPGKREPNVLGRMSFLLLAGSVYTGQPVSTRR